MGSIPIPSPDLDGRPGRFSPRLGPVDPARSLSAEQLLPAARAAARRAGVTRLAEVTRLDRLGLPVWQAVRPMSRALSVHQGKGATDAEAQIGALLEAVESHAAETFEGDGPCCRLADLPARGRPLSLADFALDRRRPPPDGAYRWAEAADLVTGERAWLPFDIVSLDFTRGVPSPFDRASNGVAAGATRDEAVAVALQEFVERDAVTEWQAGGTLALMSSTVELETVPFGWLGDWRARLRAAEISVRFYRVPSLTGTPVFACELNDLSKHGDPFRAIQGRGCHPVPEIALFKSLAEAIQVRATFIAGARDDMLPDRYARRGAPGMRVTFAPPRPPSLRGVAWDEIAPGPAGSAAIGEALARAGYPRIPVVELAWPEGLAVVRAFVCGLGSIRRRRRAAA